jgi:hypothetical protein
MSLSYNNAKAVVFSVAGAFFFAALAVSAAVPVLPVA